MQEITLKSAIEIYKKAPGAPVNSYQWYRRMAQSDQCVTIGGLNIAVYKRGGIWYLDKKELETALKNHKKRKKIVKEATRNLQKGIIMGKDGDIIEIEGGRYIIYGGFRFEESDYEHARHLSYGTWYCNRCNLPAITKHDNPECHRCRDWSGCGKDCTLSEVKCEQCGHVLSF